MSKPTRMITRQSFNVKRTNKDYINPQIYIFVNIQSSTRIDEKITKIIFNIRH